jgi:divalent metal cation (Fe/Co/Zn/Cd) transporter
MTHTQRLYILAYRLSLFTILYNIAEGVIGTFFGYKDESLTLFGFGADSFIEVLSGLGIAHMVFRTQQNPDSPTDRFEKTALKITGVSFYLLVVGLLATSVYNIVTNQKPETTLVGVILSVVSIIIMLALYWSKIKVGKKLSSDAILADAECTKVCVYMSFVLLGASAIYELTHIAYVDVIGSGGLAWLSYNEGKECFEKARSGKLCLTEET